MEGIDTIRVPAPGSPKSVGDLIEGVSFSLESLTELLLVSSMGRNSLGVPQKNAVTEDYAIREYVQYLHAQTVEAVKLLYADAGGRKQQ
jgi:hypothetical protein